jgi:hypothetical protein
MGSSGSGSAGSAASGTSGSGTAPGSGATSGASAMASGSGSGTGASTGAAGVTSGAASGGASNSGSGAGASGSGTGSTSGTGGASGSGATTGAADGGTSGLVLPIERGNLDVYQFGNAGNTVFEVDGTQGARITEFSMDGTNVLTGSTINAQFWGGTFWTAPQDDWWTGMVPPNYAPIDYGPYVMTVGADSSISAVGSTATFATPAKMVAVTKTFSFDPATSAVLITYSMTNKGTASIKIGHWELARVFPGGLTFYPAAAAAPTVAFGTITLQKIGAYEWFDETTFPKGGVAAKSVGDAAMGGGWIAHVVPDPAGPLVLIRTFPDIPVGSAGAGDGAVEIFVQTDNTYEEIETHNELVTIAAGQSAPWQVRWMLRRLPVGTAVTAGSQALIDFVTKQLP